MERPDGIPNSKFVQHAICYNLGGLLSFEFQASTDCGSEIRSVDQFVVNWGRSHTSFRYAITPERLACNLISGRHTYKINRLALTLQRRVLLSLADHGEVRMPWYQPHRDGRRRRRAETAILTCKGAISYIATELRRGPTVWTVIYENHVMI